MSTPSGPNSLPEGVPATPPAALAGEAPSSGPPMCIGCGYDLRGLAAGGVCPECGIEIRLSMQRSKLLRYALRSWLRDLARGAQLMYLSIVILFVLPLGGSLLVIVAGVLWEIVGLPTLPAWGVTVLAVMGVLLLVAAVLAYVVGCWWISSAPEAAVVPRRAARFCVRWFGPALAPLVVWGDVMFPVLPWPWQPVPRLAVTALGWSVVFSLGSIYHHLERRTSSWDPKLAVKHRGNRSNAVVMLLICAAPPVFEMAWFAAMGRGASNWSIGGLGLALGILALFFLRTMHRVRDAVWVEYKVAMASGGDVRSGFSVAAPDAPPTAG